MREIINQENIKRLQALSDAGINVNDFLENIMKFNNESINCFVDIVSKINEKKLILDIASESKDLSLNYWTDINNESIIWAKNFSGGKDVNDILCMRSLDFRDMINKYYIKTFKDREIEYHDDDDNKLDDFFQLFNKIHELQTNSTSMIKAYKNLVRINSVDLNNYPELFNIKVNKVENTYKNESERIKFFFREQEKVMEFIFKITHVFYFEMNKKYNELDYTEKQKENLIRVKRGIKDFEIEQQKVYEDKDDINFEKILENQTEKDAHLLRCCGAFINLEKEKDELKAKELLKKEINVL